MTADALIKFILRQDDTVRCRLELAHVPAAELDALQEPGLWRLRFEGHTATWIVPVRLIDLDIGGSSQGNRLPKLHVSCTAVVPIDVWPQRSQRWERQRVRVTLERLQRDLFHVEHEHFAEFVNNRMSARRHR
jgi:hypothetical protein